MNVFENLEKYYEKAGNKTYYSVNGQNQLLLFHPNLKISKIYGIFTSNNDDLIHIGCIEYFRNELHLLFRDCSRNNYTAIIAKINEINEDTTKELKTDYIDSCLCPKILFENQESIVLDFLKDNGYKLLSL